MWSALCHLGGWHKCCMCRPSYHRRFQGETPTGHVPIVVLFFASAHTKQFCSADDWIARAPLVSITASPKPMGLILRGALGCTTKAGRSAATAPELVRVGCLSVKEGSSGDSPLQASSGTRGRGWSGNERSVCWVTPPLSSPRSLPISRLPVPALAVLLHRSPSVLLGCIPQQHRREGRHRRVVTQWGCLAV